MALSTLSYWKISPPLIRKILALSLKITRFEGYIFVEIEHAVWKCSLRFVGCDARN
jgi:hypothetical protein